MSIDSGYIDVSQIKPPPKRTLRNDITVIISKFGKQRFFAKHVLWVLLEEEHYKARSRSGLYASIRRDVLNFVDEGLLEIVSRGKPGTCNVYRALQGKTP